MERDGQYYDAPDWTSPAMSPQTVRKLAAYQVTDVKCRSCANTGIDFMGQRCSCPYGDKAKLEQTFQQVAEAESNAPTLTIDEENQVARIQAVARGRQTRAEIADLKGLNESQMNKLAAAQQQADDRRAFLKDVNVRLGVTKDAYNASPALQKANVYLEKHNVPQLLDTLLAQAALHRPEDLREYLVQLLTGMKNNPQNTMGPFTDEDLETMFDMWDELKTGTVPVNKVAEQLKALQVSPERAELAVQKALKLGSVEEVRRSDLEVVKADFVKIIRAELWSMFSSKAFRG